MDGSWLFSDGPEGIRLAHACFPTLIPLALAAAAASPQTGLWSFLLLSHTFIVSAPQSNIDADQSQPLRSLLQIQVLLLLFCQTCCFLVIIVFLQLLFSFFNPRDLS